ncbi:MAG: glycosyltransferase family 4 protein [Deltaproteobacteria bacterium]|jgi:glycosyltransferase involved in cell wall biosynthesis|nr:glycosyltransferase family 4 protein [Deltaproteobacteria bacterium]MBT6433911.1 glycosyltransferase family 4 protein [Deltaproteobacteria bacterium]MBT6489759.1 glycosyltransferase family 4 protein [Deltaproteobacteria bacterium]
MTGLRIAMVVPDFPRVGGYERQAMGLCTELLRQGHHPYLVTNARPGKSYPAMQDGLELVVLTERPRFRQHPFLFMRAFLYHLKTRQVDCVHAHAMAPFSSAAIMAAQSLSIPTILKLAGIGDKKAFWAGSDLNFRMARRGPKVASHTVALCEAMDDVAMSFGAPKERILRVPNGVDTANFQTTDEQDVAALRVSLGIGADQRVLLYVGRLSTEKGLQTLFDSVLPLLRKDPSLRLCLVGDGPMCNGLREEVQSKGLEASVIFAGFQKETRAYYAMADLFVLPSYEEGMSNALLEAMASGLPVVATDVGAAREMLGQEYVLASPGESVELRIQIEHRLAKLSQGESEGALLQRRCEELFSMQAVAQRYASLYGELVSEPKPSALPSVVQATGHAMAALWSR